MLPSNGVPLSRSYFALPAANPGQQFYFFACLVHTLLGGQAAEKSHMPSQ